jgi:formylglycine-generating enzyme required for sulfatase activity
MKKIIVLLIAIVLYSSTVFSNNVQLTNVSIINNGPGAIQVQFDVSWDNSWRINVGPANYDGVWVFFKYKQAGGNWIHMNLTGLNNVIPAGFDVFQNPTGTNKIGAMLFRDVTNMGTGSATVTGVRLGVVNTLPYNIDVRGMALEMVYIPAPSGSRPSFGDGDGTAESVNALHYTDNTATNNSVLPMLCDANGFDDGELETDGIYVYSNDTIQTTNPIGALEPFPTMKSLWTMKYEITQAGYRDFLNTLDSLQQVTRTSVPVTSATGTSALSGGTSRNFIEIVTPATSTTAAVYGCDGNGNNVYNEAGDGEWIACNFLAWVDVAAYLDWSGLAPMSELQYERMCRGNTSAGANPAVLAEYAWGTNSIFGSAYTLSNAATTSEIASNASTTVGNAAYSTTASTGPLRSGIFATATSNRITSGASFYGVMDLSGNMPEYCISLGQQAGRSCHFIPNGNGLLSTLGNAQLSVGGAGFWPGMEGNLNTSATTTCSGTCEVTSSGGIRFRGGSVSDPATNLSVSDRGVVFTPTARAANRGGRGVLYIR